MQKPFGVIIVGGTGYGAGELLRMLAPHPAIEVCGVVSRSHGGDPVASVHTHLAGIVGSHFDAAIDLSKLRDKRSRAVILAMPPGQASPTIQSLRSLGLDDHTKVIDLSGDFRLRNETSHAEFYAEVPWEPELRQRFTYGLPELDRTAISATQFITNPGCLATGAILALAPLREMTDSGNVVIDAKTGTSGAGREPQASMHHPGRFSDFTAYKPLSHRHEPEIVQALGERFEQNFGIMFVPHLIPVSRGIFVSAYVSQRKNLSKETVEGAYREFYRDSPFIRFRSAPPRLVDVVGTNFCDIFIATRASQIVVMTALDNLGKGMAGQAIQNLNLALALPEETGLLVPALGPA
jgi:N-acetyl-gamma-glutamyl-phosphate/LysW-gamma-L-alpha-aminoadipyl-6-phosphate reductase